MREEYSKLGKSLFFFYMTRLIALVIIFYGAFSYCNDFYTDSFDQFPNSESSIPFDRLAIVMESSASVLRSVSAMSQLIIRQNSGVDVGNHCTANQSFSDCQSFLFDSLENQLVYSTYGIYTSFWCVTGDCMELSALWDYYWMFKIRLPFINYLLVQYSINGSQSERLVAPACSKETLSLDSFDGNSSVLKWSLIYKNNVLAMSMIDNSSEVSTIKATIVFDTNQLFQKYSVQPISYDIPSAFPSSSDYYKTYTLEGQALFGYHRNVSLFIVSSWFYNLMEFAACIMCAVPMVYIVGHLINTWEGNLFKQLQSLDSLYQYQINAMFEGEKPKKSVVLSDNSFTCFYEDLSQVVDKDCDPLLTSPPAIQKEETFKFIDLIDRVMEKFQESLKPLEEERGREFSNLKPQIRSAISEISQSVDRRLRDLFVKSRELMFTAQFFHFGYLAILEPTSIYQQLLVADSTILPEAMVSLFRYMNHTINSENLKYTFKFAFAYNHIIQQQIIMRLQDQLLPKYLDSLRNLDSGNPPYRQRLGLTKRITDLDLMIENKRHISAIYLK